MAKIVDPDLLVQDTDIRFDATGKTIQVLTGSSISSDGVSLQCLYSFCKTRWRLDNNLIKYAFPMIAVTAEQFELVNEWDFKDQSSKNLIRDGGWALKNLLGISQEEYMNVTTLGSFDNANTDKAYYLQTGTTTSTDAVFTGPVNQAVKIYGDVTHDNFDYRTFFKIYLREEKKKYDYYDLIASQNLSTLTYRKYAMPLSNSTDLKVTHFDYQIASGSTTPNITPYSWMSITYTTGTTRTIGTSAYTFSVIINGSGATAEQIYEFAQWSLRQTIDIDAGSGSVTGKTTESLLEFVGDTLRTKLTSRGGVYIDNYALSDTNRLEFTDNTGSIRTFPYVATGTIQFNDNLINDSNAKYWIYFTNAGGNQFGTANAILVNDANDIPLSGVVNSQASISFSFDYDANTQGGRTGATDAAYTAVALGLDTGQYVKTTGSITRSTANIISFVAALERNYSNP